MISPMAAKLDKTDLKILAILQQDASLSVAEIAAQVNLSQTPCWRRIQRMEADGVITGRVALVNPDAIGVGLTIFVDIETNDHSREWLGKFAQVVREMPEVMDVYRMAGDVDYMLWFAVSRMSDYDDFYRRLISAVPLNLSPVDFGRSPKERNVANRDGARQGFDGLSDQDRGGRRSWYCENVGTNARPKQAPHSSRLFRMPRGPKFRARQEQKP
jgi:Lrp/AsnC family transcriptional regulator